MVFSSLTFLFLFLPVVIAVYYAVPRKAKNFILFIFSLLFYAWGEPVYVCLMLLSTVLDYTCGFMADKYRGKSGAKAALIVSVCANLGLLCFFKYSGLFITTINNITGLSIPTHDLPLPIGISFYTFQTMSYTIDVYRGDAKVQKNIISFGAYVALFPQLIAGPIVRYQTIADQIDERKESFALFSDGVKRFAVGLGKKVLLANNIGVLWETVSSSTSNLSALSALSAWLGIIAFGFQIYFDFSGYSDMAIGLGKMFGFEFDENFKHPYVSKSITEFWRRWHISLGSWFRDYVYIPLGGNRCSKLKNLRNISVVWLLTGLWHGASWNFLLWGAYYGILLIMEKLFLLKVLDKIPKLFQHIYMIFCTLIGWTLFAFEDTSKWFKYVGAMFGANKAWSDGTLYQLMSNLPLIIVCIAACLPVAKKIYTIIDKKASEAVMTIIDSTGIAAVSILSLAFLISSSYNPFLYFRF